MIQGRIGSCLIFVGGWAAGRCWPIRGPADSPARAGGYALVALLAFMTILMLLMISAAPGINQQVWREREKEAFFRGEEVAEAIAEYVRAKNGALPTSLEQLFEGIPVGTKRHQILRHSSARDPLSHSGEWRLIGPGDPELAAFHAAVTLYAGGVTPPTRHQHLEVFAARIESLARAGGRNKSAGQMNDSGDEPKPFIGVASRNKGQSVINYYGIGRRDKWVFTPLFR